MTFIAFGNTPPGASSFISAALFGTGADGNVTISSGTTTLTRDMHYNNLTITGTGVLETSGFRVFVRGTLDLSAAPSGAIVSARAGSLTFSPWLPIGPAGRAATAGGTGVGTAGTAGPQGSAAYGGRAGASGAGGSGGSGAGGAAATPAATVQIQAATPQIFFNGSTGSNGGGTLGLVAGGGGSSGGSGAGDGTNSGGNGGAGGVGGHFVAIFAANIQRGTNSNTALIQAKGFNAGPGAIPTTGNTGGGGGGAGGSGGFVYILVGNLLDSTIANAIDVSPGLGGAGGSGKGTGQGGDAGSTGYGGGASIINLSAQTYTQPVTWNQTANAGGVHSGITGGSAPSALVVQGNL